MCFFSLLLLGVQAEAGLFGVVHRICVLVAIYRLICTCVIVNNKVGVFNVFSVKRALMYFRLKGPLIFVPKTVNICFHVSDIEKSINLFSEMVKRSFKN